ncbi:MAG: glycosyltransferase family 4 protein [Deltaproteobacteria bacterium]|nr:glycosyltransferase family 4 protein [Deltaproteobacteria bacterium]
MRDGLQRPTVLMVSKPVAPPWNDSSKNLVKDLARAGRRFGYRVLTPSDYRLEGPGIVSEPLYRGGGAHTPALVQNLRVMGRLLRSDDSALTHFFFAPNPKASLAARLCLRLRSRRTVQTVCSTPQSFARPDRLLFADRVVVLSRHTESSFLAAGVAPSRLRVIPPGIELPDPPTEDERLRTRRRFGLPVGKPVVIYPGDYQFSDAAETVARAALQLGDLEAHVVFACRIKQEASRSKEAEIRGLLAEHGGLARALLLNDVPDILALIAACDLCVLPAESLYAKMDLPLVLLEALALRVPIVVADVPPLNEVLVGDVGAAVPPRDPAALAQTVRTLLANEDARRRMGERGRLAVQSHFGIARVAELHEELYEELLQTAVRGSG